MKKYTTYSLTLFVLSTIALMSSCTKDDPTATDIAKGKLMNSWQIESVTVDDVDQLSLFTGMTLTYTANTYQTTNSGPVWQADGTWRFVDNDPTKVLLDETVEVDIITLTEEELVLELMWDHTTHESGRTVSLSGLHRFTFNR